MSMATLFVTATFTIPESIGTDIHSLLWLLPLAASIAVIYKATKMTTITAKPFFKEAAVLFGSIVVFIVITALVLLAVSMVFT